MQVVSAVLAASEVRAALVALGGWVVQAGPAGLRTPTGRANGRRAVDSVSPMHKVRVGRLATWAADARRGSLANAGRRADRPVSSAHSETVDAVAVAAAPKLRARQAAGADVAAAAVVGGVRRSSNEDAERLAVRNTRSNARAWSSAGSTPKST
ncbi:MAG: hypothetical protein JO227_19405 [Acetobacteraceae bacterium]|nr:hypothetical protein [Acetobacteraceae bacterium]